jgi:hypothetical protein
MNERGDQVGLDEKFPCGRLDPQANTHTADFACKRLLAGPRSDMFDHTVGEYDAERLVLKWERAPVAGHLSNSGDRFRVRECAGKIQQGDLRDSFVPLPKPPRAADVEKLVLLAGSNEGVKDLRSPPPEPWRDPLINPVDGTHG